MLSAVHRTVLETLVLTFLVMALLAPSLASTTAWVSLFLQLEVSVASAYVVMAGGMATLGPWCP